MAVKLVPMFCIAVIGAFLATTFCVSDFGDSVSGSIWKSRAKRTANDDLVTSRLRDALGAMRELMKVGIPEFGIGPLEPVRLDNMTIDSQRTGAHVKSNFTNMTLFGISTLEIRTISVALAQQKLAFQLAFKNWKVQGNYNMSGHLIKFIPIYGIGPFTMEASNVLVSGTAALNRMANGTLAVDNMKLDLTVDDVKSHFHNLNGGGAMSGIANSILSFLSESIFNNSKPKLIEKLKATLDSSLNRSLRSLTVNF